jgi:adenylyltransferase/sulfurtransferase
MAANDQERYSRQVRFEPLGESGQARLLSSRVAIVGCGALGSFQAGSLARAGVGDIVIVDRDYVEWSNLQRQWLFDESDAEQALPKAIAAANHLAKVNSRCRVTPVVADLTPANIKEVIEGCWVILDGTDNFETRYLLNDYAVAYGVPWIYGAAVGSYGISMPVVPGSTACFACVYPSPPSGSQPTCETAGVLNMITAAVASLQSADAMKILAGGQVRSRMTTMDVWSGIVHQVTMPAPDPSCRACGERRFDYLDDRRRAPISLCGRNAVQIHERSRPVDLRALGDRLARAGEVRVNDFALRFFVPPYEMTVFPDGRAIIKGTTETGVARSLYSRYVGA